MQLQKLSDVVAFVKSLPEETSTDKYVSNFYLLLALQLELLGTEQQLMYSMDAALEAFEWCRDRHLIAHIHTYIDTYIDTYILT